MSIPDLSRTIMIRLSDGVLDLGDTKAILNEDDPWLSATPSIGGDLSETEYGIIVTLDSEVQTGKQAALGALRMEQQLIAARYGLLPPLETKLTQAFAAATALTPGRVIAVTPEAADALHEFVLSRRPDSVQEEALAGVAAGVTLSGAVTAATAAGGVWESTVVGARLGGLGGWAGLAAGAALGLSVGLLYWAFDD